MYNGGGNGLIHLLSITVYNNRNYNMAQSVIYFMLSFLNKIKLGHIVLYLNHSYRC